MRWRYTPHTPTPLRTPRPRFVRLGLERRAALRRSRCQRTNNHLQRARTSTTSTATACASICNRMAWPQHACCSISATTVIAAQHKRAHCSGALPAMPSWASAPGARCSSSAPAQPPAPAARPSACGTPRPSHVPR